jgi:hypothetical protein
VNKLIPLAQKQLDTLKSRGEGEELIKRALTLSTENTRSVRDMHLDRSLRCKINVGRFIGKGGCNLKRLQRGKKAMIYQDHKVGTTNNWLVFYADNAALEMVKNAMGY